MPPLDRDELLATRERFARFHEWEREHPHELTPQEALAAVSGLYRMLPAETRDHDPDPAHADFHRLLETLALLRG